MKLTPFVVSAVLMASGCPAWSAALDQKSKAPDWSRATPAEKDAWIAAFAFKHADTKRADVAACLDEHADRPLFKDSDLAGVTQMCETIARLP